MISENLESLQDRINKVCARSGRRVEEVTLVCVTKEVSADEAKEAISLGVQDVGENRVQDALTKYQAIGPSVNWHMIGHLQTNKAKQAVKIFDLIHSVDSLKLAEQLDKEAGKLEKKQDILIQVNTSGEESKFGVEEKEVVPLVKAAANLKNLRIKGLMTMAPFVDEPEKTRAHFKRLRFLAERIASMSIEGVVMHYLSMGMSQDFEVAIEEGANLVRIGSSIFKG